MDEARPTAPCPCPNCVSGHHEDCTEPLPEWSSRPGYQDTFVACCCEVGERIYRIINLREVA